MKVAVLSDIHGNIDSLKSVLIECESLQIDIFIVLGDLVGYYYNPKIVLDTLLNFNTIMIQGNHERILGDILAGTKEKTYINSKYGLGHQVALDTLDSNSISYLLDLPVSTNVTLDGLSFSLNHGTPWDSDQYLYPDADEDILRRCITKEYDFVLVGHSHYSFSYKGEYGTLINVGSVGQNRKRGGYADWVFIDTRSKYFEIKSTKYNVQRLSKMVKQIDPNHSYNYNILNGICNHLP